MISLEDSSKNSSVKEDSNIKQYLVSIFSWNLASNLPGEDIAFAKLLKRESIAEAPDIAVFGFQEVIELGITNMFSDLDSKTIQQFGLNLKGTYPIKLYFSHLFRCFASCIPNLYLHSVCIQTHDGATDVLILQRRGGSIHF